MSTKKAKIFAIIAACLFATCALLRLIALIPTIEFLRMYPAQWLLFRLLLISVIGALAVMLFMNKHDWVLVGICAGGATIKLISFFTEPSAASFFGLLAILGLGAIVFLKMRGIKIVKFLFYVPAALELIAYLSTGSISIAFDYGFVGMLQSFVSEQLLIAGYLMFGFWILRLPEEQTAPAYAAVYAMNAPASVYPETSVQETVAAAPEVQEQSQSARFCIYCGKKNNASDTFCAGCGNRLI